MTLQNKCRLVFVSRKHQRASTRFSARPYAALVLVLLLFGIVGRLDAASVGVSSADVTDNELLSFVAGGTTYTQSDLIHPTLTEFRGDSARNIGVPFGGSVPAPGTRSLLLTHDFNLDTGIINPGIGATAATLQFSPPLINGPGPDLVMFESDRPAADDFVMQINGITMTYLGTFYDTPLLDDPIQYQFFNRDAGTPDNISQLENDPYSAGLISNENVFGIAIDLDDFAVGPLGMVSTVHFGSFGEPTFNDSFDPVLFMGIVPEPSTVVLAAIGLVGLAAFGWRRRKR